MPQRTYSEEEIAQIIKRAAELESDQSGNKKKPEGSPGLSLQELSAIAVEAGLDPENVRIAADELESPSKKSISKSTGNEIYSERWVYGELNEDLADMVIADLNHRYNTTHEKKSWMDDILENDSMEWEGKSKVQRTGNSLEWKHLNEYGTVEVRALIQPVKDQIRIRISKKNVWGTSISDLDGGLMDYLSYIPFLAAFIVLLSLPYSFVVNSIIAILAFAALQFGFIPVAKKLNEKWERMTGGPGEKKSAKFSKEVEIIADELAQLLGEPQTRENRPGKIEISEDTRSEKQRGNKESGKKRKRER